MDKLVVFIKSKYFFYLISFSIFLAISINIPLVADDFSFSMLEGTNARIVTLSDIIRSVSYQYMNWNGRILGYAITELCLLGDNHIIFTIAYPIVNTLVIEQIFRIASTRKKVYLYYLILALILSIHILVLNQTIFWIVGWSTYFVALIPLLYIIEYSKKIFSNNDHGNMCLLFVASFTGCLFVEHYSLIILCLNLIIIVYLVHKKQISLNSIVSLVGAIIGALVILLAPGVSARSSSDLTNTLSFLDSLHFGWSRFIYCFFI